jgi:hypothetical protein
LLGAPSADRQKSAVMARESVWHQPVCGSIGQTRARAS